jgi:hypothetical protein
MLGFRGNPATGRLKAQLQARKHRCWPFLLRQKRPVEFAPLTYVSQQDRAAWSQPADHILRKHKVLSSVTKYFWCSSPVSIIYFIFKMTSHLKLQVEVEDWIENKFEVFKPHSKKPSTISHHLAVLIGHDSAELRWFLVRSSSNSNRLWVLFFSYLP